MGTTSYSDKPKVLMIMHQEASTPGRCGMMLEDMGYRLESCKPAIGDTLPETLEDYAGAVVFGGPMSANDEDDFIKREIDWMEIPLKENKPFFGICLGAQMLSKQLGGNVVGREDNYSEIGYYPIRPTNEGQALMDWPDHVYHWHMEGFSLPEDATLLATGEHYPNQAFRYGEKAFGVQFHSEVTTWMMNRWTTKAYERFALPGAQNREEQFAARPLYDPAVRQWLDTFLHLWIGPAENQA
ncbi:MAG: glutamine amidotransferase [Pseudomonadota bacterium]